MCDQILLKNGKIRPCLYCTYIYYNLLMIIYFSEEQLLDASDVIETRDKNDEELIRKPARQISMTICLYCRESQRNGVSNFNINMER